MMFWRAAIAALALSCLQVPAGAEDWPSKPVRVLIGFGAGGGTDVATRILAEGLAEALGQQFVVENRPGAGGTIAGSIAAKAPNDGYTLLAASTGHAVSAVMVKRLPYDPVADFEPVGAFATSAYVVAVTKASPVTDLASLVAYAKKEEGKLNYSTIGLGSTQHLILEDVRQRTGLTARHVAFRTTGEVVTALLRGDIAFAADLYHALRGQVEAGDLRLIATSTPERWPAIPNVPTLAESGLSGFGYTGWYALLFPAGTPPAVVDKLRNALRDVLSRDAVRQRLEGVGAHPTLSTPAELRTLIESDIRNFQDVARKAGLEAQ